MDAQTVTILVREVVQDHVGVDVIIPAILGVAERVMEIVQMTA